MRKGHRFNRIGIIYGCYRLPISNCSPGRPEISRPVAYHDDVAAFKWAVKRRRHPIEAVTMHYRTNLSMFTILSAEVFVGRRQLNGLTTHSKFIGSDMTKESWTRSHESSRNTSFTNAEGANKSANYLNKWLLLLVLCRLVAFFHCLGFAHVLALLGFPVPF